MSGTTTTGDVMNTFREDGAAAVEWVASYLERVSALPVLSEVEPGDIRAALPSSPPDEPEAFESVLRDLDGVLMPGLTHWQSPRFFAYFATTASEPGVLAELLVAGLNQVGILWRTSPALQELEEVTLDWLAQLLGLPPELHGHIEDGRDDVALEGAGRAGPVAGRQQVEQQPTGHGQVEARPLPGRGGADALAPGEANRLVQPCRHHTVEEPLRARAAVERLAVELEEQPLLGGELGVAEVAPHGPQQRRPVEGTLADQGAEALPLLVLGPLHDGHEQAFEGAEVVDEHAVAGADRRGQLAQAGVVQAVLAQVRRRRVEELGTGAAHPVPSGS